MIAGGSDINGFWRDEHGLPSWVEVNFNGPKTIQEINVLTIQDCPSCLSQGDPSARKLLLNSRLKLLMFNTGPAAVGSQYLEVLSQAPI